MNLHKLCTAMKIIEKYPICLWWDKEPINRLFDKAETLGLIFRPSQTQVEWTQKGVDAIIQQRNNTK